jgi:hypothetical protein
MADDFDPFAGNTLGAGGSYLPAATGDPGSLAGVNWDSSSAFAGNTIDANSPWNWTKIGNQLPAALSAAAKIPGAADVNQSKALQAQQSQSQARAGGGGGQGLSALIRMLQQRDQSYFPATAGANAGQPVQQQRAIGLLGL